ncbi:ROK family protein [Oryzifoliimicrobium ureilyticus]|uniref:ROK family protein n=1 Tax=Oryzifoliimicrobium ureilyticus TaxID=3113724 RepID=UPI0030762502
MSAAVSELERHGLVAPAGVNRGGVGRTSVTYSVAPEAGLVIGVDFGTTQIHGIACGIDGRRIAEVENTAPAAMKDERFEALERLIAELLQQCPSESRFLRAIVIALPNIISPAFDRLPGSDLLLPVLDSIGKTYGVPILLENNVNCAALAEYHHGAARSHSFTIYMQIGVKVGVGIVIDGKLFRGFRGGAGEIGHLPFPWSEHEQPRPSQVEAYLGSAALLERAIAAWPANEGPAPKSTNQLFSLAEEGGMAREIIKRHACDIGNLAAACVSLLDPELIVVGGGVGQNQVLITEIRETVERLCWPVEIVSSELLNHATALGAVRLARDFSLARLLGEEAKASFLHEGDQLSRLVSV